MFSLALICDLVKAQLSTSAPTFNPTFAPSSAARVQEGNCSAASTAIFYKSSSSLGNYILSVSTIAPLRDNNGFGKISYNDSTLVYSDLSAHVITSDGCTDYGQDLSGLVVFVERGNCTYFTKSFYAARAGADVIVIFNSNDTDPMLDFSLPEPEPSNADQNRVNSLLVLGVSKSDFDVMNASGISIPGTLVLKMACEKESTVNPANKTEVAELWKTLGSFASAFDPQVSNKVIIQ